MPKKFDFASYYQAALNSEDYERFLLALQKPPRRCLRVNTLRISVIEFKRMAANIPTLTLEPVPWSNEAFFYEVKDAEGRFTSLGYSDLYAQGLIYIQDASSLLPVEVLDPKPGDMVLDLAAAPGGKTTFMAQKMQNTGLIVANEVVRDRAFTLQKMLANYSVINTAVTAYDVSFFANLYPNFFDKILLDAPCSGEGMRVRGVDITKNFSYNKVKFNAKRQTRLLKNAFLSLKPGGTLVYSTCALAVDENEAVVADFLQKHQELAELLPINVPEANGLTAFMDKKFDQRVKNTARLWPHVYNTNGFYVAAFRKIGLTPVRNVRLTTSPPREKFWHKLARKETLFWLNRIEKKYGVAGFFSRGDYNLVQHKNELWLQPILLRKIRLMRMWYAGIKVAEVLTPEKCHFTEEFERMVKESEQLSN